MEIEVLKKCSKCGEFKPHSMFYKHRPASGGLRPNCKICANSAAKTWNKSNREKVRLSYNYLNTGVSPESYIEFLNFQNGKCAICGKTAKENNENLAVDHCHKTMKIRGLLCRKCNLGIAHLEDDIEILKTAIEYIQNPPLINKDIDFKPRKTKVVK